jgi:GGDEF domain-containing protein|tara:strand:+ start:646 stop:897 length:252 start_codon:yes stop_codon:yes gene_type:complete
MDDSGHIAQTIIHALTEPVLIVAKDYKVGASLGISIYPDDATDSQFSMRCANETMYKVKESGQNDFIFHSSKSEKNRKHNGLE